MKYLIAGEEISFELRSKNTIKKFHNFRNENIDAIQFIDMSGLELFIKNNNHLSYNQCELIYTMQKFFLYIACKKKLMVHATLVVVDDNGFLFFGKAGSGKSTMLRRWMDFFEKEITAINDDRCIVGNYNNNTICWLSPWSKNYFGSTTYLYRIKGIAFLSKNDNNILKKIDLKDAIEKISSEYPSEVGKLVRNICNEILIGLNFLDVKCNKNIDVKSMYEMMK